MATKKRSTAKADQPTRKAGGKSTAQPAAKTSTKSPGKAAAKTTVKTSGKPPAKVTAKVTAKKPAGQAAPKTTPKTSAKADPKKAAATTKKAAPIKSARKPAQSAAKGDSGKKPARASGKATPGKGSKVPSLPHIEGKILLQIIAKLEEMRDESLKVINTHMQTDLQPREEASDVGDDLDQASNERDREFNLIMHQRHLRRLQQVEEAFDRIEDGIYGLCEGTDEPINPKRLLIMPLARYSLDYQEQQEKMLGRAYNGATVFDSDESFSTDD